MEWALAALVVGILMTAYGLTMWACAKIVEEEQDDGRG